MGTLNTQEREFSFGHPYIEEHQVVARYEMGKLVGAERADFEEHLVDCPECQEQLATTRDFRQALRTAIAQDAGRKLR